MRSGDGARLEVLGRIGLRANGEDLRVVLVQPKRVGLLVYIALRRAGGFTRRDELLSVFWPESTEARARAALRQALRFLRSEIGSSTIETRGSEVAIQPAVLSCDALDFSSALAAGEDERALEFYGGDLLPAFHLDGVAEFDRWLYEERQRLRAAAVEAALRIASRAEAARDLGGAADRVRLAFEIDPTDETIGRRLISLLAHAGQRGAAVSVYESLADRLRRDLDLEPSPATVELIAAVRDTAGAGAQSATFDMESLSPQRVLVLPLDNFTDDEAVESIGRLAADSIAQGLATIPDIEVVFPMSAEVARRAGAGTLVSGAIHGDGDMFRFHVVITDIAGGRLLPGPDPVLAPKASPLQGLETLRERVMTSVGPALTRRVTHVREAQRPPGIEAYRAYLDGLELFIRGEWQAALVHLRRSAEREPEYALPRIVCAIAHWNLGEVAQSHAAALDAARLRPDLGRFEAAVLDMIDAWLIGDWAEARRAAHAQAELAPGSIPHFQAAEEARRLNRPREAFQVLAGLDADSGELRGWIYYWVELAAALHLLGDHERELEFARRCRGMHPDDRTAALLEIRALAALGHAEDVRRILDAALSSPGTREPVPGALMFEAGRELHAHGSFDAAVSCFDDAVAWYRERASGAAPGFQRELGRALYHAGQLGEARSVFVALARSNGGRAHPVGFHHLHLQAHLDEGYLAVIATREGNSTEAAHWCELLRSLETPFLFGAQWFWLAAVAALQDDPARAVRMLRRAFADGLPMELFLHTDPHLARLRGFAAFDALLKPRG
jgi:DNA-binding SARP family transcriptional activator/tetratricopeptide (TPR) repeat protein